MKKQLILISIMSLISQINSQGLLKIYEITPSLIEQAVSEDKNIKLVCKAGTESQLGLASGTMKVGQVKNPIFAGPGSKEYCDVYLVNR